jgi:hypothetical protein
MGLAVLLLSGCGEGVKLVQETESGGIVTYPYRSENGHLVSPFRSEAIRLIEKRCAGRYSIVKEGETKGRTRTISPVPGAEETVREFRWGMQFKCR